MILNEPTKESVNALKTSLLVNSSASQTTNTGKPLPILGQNKSVLSKVGGVATELAKGVIEPIATMVARPIQLASELLGATDEQVNEFTQKHFGDFVAPTPQNKQDVVKDVGRGVQTALSAGLGKVGVEALTGKTALKTALKIGSAEGAGFGLGASMEQGNKILSQETAKSVALGAGLGVTIPLASRGVGKLMENFLGKKIIKEEVGTLGKTLTKEEPMVSPTTNKEYTLERPAPIIGGNKEVLSNINKPVEQKRISEVVGEIKPIQPTEFKPQTIEEQEQIFAKHDMDYIRKVVSGEVKPTDMPNTAYQRIANNLADEIGYKTGDWSLSRELSKSNIHREAGQALVSVGREETVSSILNDVRQNKIKNLPSNIGKQIDNGIVEKKIIKTMKSEIENRLTVKPSRKALREILEFIKCK